MAEFIGPSNSNSRIEDGRIRDLMGKSFDTVGAVISYAPEAVRALSERTTTIASIGAHALHLR